MPPRFRLTEAFSLLELLVCIGGIVTLASLSFMAIGQYRERATGYRCMANLRQISAATMQYAAEHRNELPYYYYVNSDGSGGSGASTGNWYYHLAPYLGVPRTEVSGAWASTERTNLGTAQNRIAAPCVFTCPGHKKTEATLWWTPGPTPMTFPANRPVSYAPPLDARGSSSPRGQKGPSIHWTGVEYYPIRLSDIPYPSQKVWISDSPVAQSLNTTATRWQDSEVYKENWARQGFSRHNGGGNALFYDGHVEWIALKTFTESKIGPVAQIARLYFNPYRDPDLDR